MGQYTQWLHHRETDQQLRAQLEQLRQELTQLQEQQTHLLEHPPLSLDNAVIQALLLQQQAAMQATRIPETPVEYTINNGSENAILATELADRSYQEHSLANGQPLEQSAASVSSALFGWSNLHYIDEPDAPFPFPKGQAFPSIPASAISYPEIDLLPEDMNAFLDDPAYNTSPRSKFPQWLRNALVPSQKSKAEKILERGPVDQQSVRTDRLIERWRERWRRGDQSETPREE